MTDNDTRMEFAKNIRNLMEVNGKTRKEICDAIGVSYTTFTDWYNGKTFPRIDKLEKLAEYFHCTKADLMKIEIDSYTEKVSFDASEIARRYDAADKTTKEMIRRILG